MARVIHLSDTHLRPPQGDVVLRALGRALAALGPEPVAAVVVTGDLFDSSAVDLPGARDLFRSLVTILREALRPAHHGPLPVVLLPGNHDRRATGVIGPHRWDLFQGLASVAPEGVHVLGLDAHFFARVITLPGVPAFVIGLDSTFLANGLFSAGGVLRTEDLLQVAAQLEQVPADRPLILLTHHHIIPTPVTDMGLINAKGSSLVAQLAVRALPRLIAHGDREELFMTALGAGTALSMLHSLGRAVLVLHGHKHYPTARLLKAISPAEGDVLLSSAGSAGLDEVWQQTVHPAPMHLWPSFNAISLDDQGVSVETVAFSLDDPDAPLARRSLLAASRQGASWVPSSTTASPRVFDRPLTSNVARYEVTPNRHSPRDELDLTCERDFTFVPSQEQSFSEDMTGLPGATIEQGASSRPLPTTLHLGPGRHSYVLRRAVCRSLERARDTYGAGTGFDWIDLPNRHGSERTELHVSGLPSGGATAFASVTDLTTGQETPRRLERDAKGVRLRVSPCPPRSLLRIYWPLESAAG